MVTDTENGGRAPAPELTVRFIGHTDDFAELDWARRFPGGNLVVNGVRCEFGGTGPADVVVTLGYSRYDYRARVRRGGVWAWHLEPRLPKPYPKCYDLVFSHLSRPNDPRFVTAAPVLDWWVDKSFDELVDLEVPEKTHQMSAIASTMQHIEGHRARHEFIQRIEQEFPEIDVYGRGRAKPLADKWQGLAPYRFTLAIENSSTPDYWTEKISDAFLAYSVPLYFGAPNISDYFPEESYIWLPMDEPEKALDVIRQTLADTSWESRLDALREARSRVLTRYSLAYRVTAEVQKRKHELLAAPMVSVTVHGRRTRKDGWMRGVGVGKNLAAQARRMGKSLSRLLRRS